MKTQPAVSSSADVLRSALLVLSLSLLAGCPIYGDARPYECAADCTCSITRDCSTGYVCLESVCVPGSETCRTHGDCAVSQYCDEGACVPSGTCTADAQCGAGFWCDYRGTCVPREPNACRSAADCAAGQLCIEGYCRGVNDTCQFDRECADGVCLNNSCVPTCGSSDDCSTGLSCQGGFCRPSPGECTTSGQCTTGEHCVEGRCLADCAGMPTSCESGTACSAEDMFCRGEWSPKPFCDSDSDCQMGRRCLSGVCRTPCTTDTTCTMTDAQLPLCRMDASSGMKLCFAEVEQTPECRTAADCGANRECLNATCRNR